jgi:hypothetical protein
LPPLATSKAIPTNNDDPQDCSIWSPYLAYRSNRIDV